MEAWLAEDTRSRAGLIALRAVPGMVLDLMQARGRRYVRYINDRY